MSSFLILQIYRFLTAEVRAYLAPFESMTVWHLRDIAGGKRKLIKCEDVKILQVPHYEGLSVEDILGFAWQYPLVV